MAYITELRVRGLAGNSRELHYKLDPHVNIFWGLNGSGKTSLLRLLHAALMNDTASLQRIPFKSVSFQIFDPSSRATFVRSIDMDAEPDEVSRTEYVQVGPEDFELVEVEGERAWKDDFLSKNIIASGQLEHTYLPISRIAESRGPRRPGSAGSGLREAISDATFDAVFARQVKLRWQSYNLEANSRIREVQQQGLAEVLSLLFGGAAGSGSGSMEQAPDEFNAYNLVRQFLSRQNIRLKIREDDFRERYRSESDLPLIVSRIQRVIADIDDALAPQKQLQALIAALYSGKKEIAFDARGINILSGGEPVQLESLSSGEKQLLQILLETLASGQSAVIIDEPELSMHVDWQRTLVRNMRLINPECQLILATHSPEVMAEIPDRNIFQL